MVSVVSSAPDIARRALVALYGGDGIADQLTADFALYRNVNEVTMNAATALADHDRMRAAFASVSVSCSRMLLTAQGVVCAPRIEGLTIRGEPFLLLPMIYVQIDSDGMIYRIDEYCDSAALAPLMTAGYRPAV